MTFSLHASKVDRLPKLGHELSSGLLRFWHVETCSAVTKAHRALAWSSSSTVRGESGGNSNTPLLICRHPLEHNTIVLRESHDVGIRHSLRLGELDVLVKLSHHVQLQLVEGRHTKSLVLRRFRSIRLLDYCGQSPERLWPCRHK